MTTCKVAVVLLAANLAVTHAVKCSFNQTEFHVDMTFNQPLLETSDVYHLTGQLADNGGTVKAQCANDTSARPCSHSIHFGDVYSKEGNHTWRNVTGTIGGVKLPGNSECWVGPSGDDCQCRYIMYKSKSG